MTDKIFIRMQLEDALGNLRYAIDNALQGILVVDEVRDVVYWCKIVENYHNQLLKLTSDDAPVPDETD